MRTKTVTVREGEYLGPVDWSYDFGQHIRGPEQLEMLRHLDAGGAWEATTDGGIPRVGWHRVLKVGMYDGWPYWRPVPSVLTEGVLGPEWQPFSSLTEIRPVSEEGNDDR